MSTTIFSASDLSRKRKEVLREARDGCARVRDTDGTSLVMLPESRLEFLERMQDLTGLHVVIDRLISRAGPGSVRDLGSHAWIRVFDRDDLAAFANELGDAMQAARGDQSSEIADEVIEAWRVTARQLEDPLRREVLMNAAQGSDFEPAIRPK